MLMCLSLVTSAPTKTGKYATYDLLEYTVQDYKYVTPPPVFPVFQKSLTDLTGWSHQPNADDVADKVADKF